ncbi:nucleotidyltransferase domain-containing protein [Halarcobacter ebronensis]|uniref:nucleotidyltransferase domain-containing protein n=1 Tax=Halarcobacter ebronensis TaxID=1462615 RepID=UPI001E5A9371|nr:nucleotidyltransferase domain-containing protein [Halarcobacter ebronensis]
MISVNSDSDILIEFENNLPNIYEKKLDLKNTLENHFHLNVDIAREKYLKPFAKNEILKEVVYV